MKGQGLPINFIIIAVLGIIILTVSVVIVYQARSQPALTVQRIKQNCDMLCMDINREASVHTTGACDVIESSKAYQEYCSEKMPGKNCNNFTTCSYRIGLNICKVKC
ncbi:MAG TPA: hypothetical protein ENG01_00925 [Candidatus Aenigmarchaeota archaeon]|nr:hypothetical protein [Candidatus Aenigmarchaeota archaeon]HEX32958.1 hypothetical protein [Candidatus Aenigmarchaeota archaeon]